MASEPARELLEHVLGRAQADDDPAAALVLADAATERADLRLAAAALDRAYGLQPRDAAVVKRRAEVLDALALKEHGLVFRYVPAGSFLMGSGTGDLDEQPVHPVRTAGFWLSDVPVSWASYARLMDWDSPPAAGPREEAPSFGLANETRIRLQYCETETLEASDWHAHAGMAMMGKVSRRNADAPPDYEQKPMVAVSWQSAEELGHRLSTRTVQYALPTEAEWEKSARGGLIGKPYSWGDEPPDPQRCDSGHFGQFAIRSPRELPPNGYGLHGMCGGVWEWTADLYDALAYHQRRPPIDAAAVARVLRGGSFTDDESAVTVSFRMALISADWRGEGRGRHQAPNVGFRLVRREGEFALPEPKAAVRRAVPVPPAEAPQQAAPKQSWLARLFGTKKK